MDLDGYVDLSKSIKKILIVVGNETDTQLLRTYFSAIENETYDLYVCKTLRDFIDLETKDQFDAILLDVILPDSSDIINTFETAKSFAPNCPIIVITAYDDKNIAIQALGNGAQDYLLKDSLNPDVLERTIKYAVIRFDLLKDIQTQHERLESLNKELSAFAYVAAHALKEPLRTVSNYISIFSDKNQDIVDAESSAYIDKILIANRHLNELISGLLEYSKVSKPQYHIVNIKHVCDGVMLMLKDIIEDSRVLISCSDLNHNILCDQLQLAQVFQNLILNAIKFQDVTRTVEINVLFVERHSYYEFSVSDNGQGVDKKDFKSIFYMFNKGSQRCTMGSGIGLSVCRKIVERHGGKMWVDSEKGVGSTFYFTISKEIINGDNGHNGRSEIEDMLHDVKNGVRNKQYENALALAI